MLKSKGRIAAAGTAIAVATSATAVLLLGGGSATAGTTAVAPANTVTGTSVVDGSLYQKDFNQDVINKVFRVPGMGSVTGWSVKDGTLVEADLSADVKKKLNAVGSGAPGKSAYEIAKANGFEGTEAEWLASLKGKDGAPGAPGKDGKPGVANLESDAPYPGSTDLSKVGEPGTQGSNSTETVPADGKSHTVWVKCADGKAALGGGFVLGADQGDAVASKIQVIASESTGASIEGDPAQSIMPTGWSVTVINNGDTAATVRPVVTCANVG